MNIKVTDPWIAVPAAILYGGLGAFAGGAIFYKLSYLAEYALNKTFGDYDNPLITPDERKVIVSIPLNQHGQVQDYYYAQNIAVVITVAAIFATVVQILDRAGCPNSITKPLLVGSVAVPILFGSLNMFLRYDGFIGRRWVVLSDEEIQKHQINKDGLEFIQDGVYAYTKFGSEPERFCGLFRDR